MPHAAIAAYGKYLPPLTVTNDQLSELVDTSDEWIRSRTGICERRIATEGNTSDLAVAAAKDILANANLAAGELEVIIVATVTPDHFSPSVACQVQAGIGASHATAFDVNSACTGFITGLSVGEKFIRAGYRRVLVVAAEALSRILDWTDRRTCVLHGDAAAGVLLTADDQPHFLAEDLGVDGGMGGVLQVGHMPLNNAFKPHEDPDQPFYHMDGRAVLDFVSHVVPESIQRALDKAGLTLADIDHFVLHQVNYRILQTVAKKLGLGMEKFFSNLNKYGNTSAASIPLCLAEMNEQGLIRKGQKAVLSGFGGGLSWGSIVMEF